MSIAKKKTGRQKAKSTAISPFSLDQILDVTIDRLAYGGPGVARVTNFVLFVDFTVPGDRVKVRIKELHKNFGRADLVSILEAGPSRRVAPCPVFGRCGGCQWQHLSYLEQVHQKALAVQFAFSKAKLPVDTLRPVVTAPEEWRYRNRIQLHLHNQRLGFYARGSHAIVDITDCPITARQITDQFPRIRDLGQSEISPEQVELFQTPSGTVEESTRGGHGEELGFSQVNTAQNLRLREVLVDLAVPLPVARIFDLYAGNGNLTWPLQQCFPTRPIYAAELNARAVTYARAFISRHPQRLHLESHIHLFEGDVSDFLGVQSFVPKTLVVMDPPRAGADRRVLQRLARLATRLDYIYRVRAHSSHPRFSLFSRRISNGQ